MNVFEMVVIIVLVSVGGGVLMKLIDAFKSRSIHAEKGNAEEGDQALRRAFVEYRKQTEDRLAQLEKGNNVASKLGKPLLDQQDSTFSQGEATAEKKRLPNMLRD